MDRLRSYFGYKAIDEGNLCVKDSGSYKKQDENAYVREMVSRATSDMLIAADWALNMDVVDFFGRSDEKTKQTVASALTSRVSYADSHVRDLALTLTDTCIKNCGPEFHKLLSDAGFGAALAKVVIRNDSGSCSVEVRNRMLAFIQEWKEGMVEGADDFQKAFNLLKFKHNVSFPLPRKKTVPINTPPARYATKEQKEEEANQAAIAAILRESEAQSLPQTPYAHVQEHRPSDSSTGFMLLNRNESSSSQTNVVNVNNTVNNYNQVHSGGQAQGQAQHQTAQPAAVIGRTVPEALDTISNSCVLLKEMLGAVDGSKSDEIMAALSDDLMVELLQQCKQGKENATSWIPSLMEDEVNLQKALSLNDEIDFCMTLHESLQSNLKSCRREEVTVQLPTSHGHDLYKSIYVQNDAAASSSSSQTTTGSERVNEMITKEEDFSLEQSENAGAVELKDIFIGSQVKREEGQGSMYSSLPVDSQPDLISFEDNTPPSPPSNERKKEESTGGSSNNLVAGTASGTQKEKSGSSARLPTSVNAQASRVEDLLSL